MRHLMTAKSLALLPVLLAFGSGGSAAVVGDDRAMTAGGALPQGANPVQRENRRAGSRSWSLDETAKPHKRIEGFASEVSVLPGQTVHFHISTAPAAHYRIELYRLGWYRGAGARLLACIPAGCHRDRKGKARRHPLPVRATGRVRAPWPVTDTFRFPRSAVSGYVLAKLVVTRGRARGQVTFVPLIVRALPTRRSKILVQASVNTWQAYNNWGGKSLYAFNSTNQVPATHVSFSRPTGAPIKWEIGLLRFLEREGYDVSYTTDIDTDRNPAELRRHPLVVSSGYNEYWTKRMRDAFEAARNSGTNLAFFGAHSGLWQIRYENNRRTIVEYRDARKDPVRNPARKTVQFGDLVPPRPQCELMGTGYGGSGTDRTRSYFVNPAALQDAWFQGTGFTATSELPGLVGFHWDSIKPGCAVPPLAVLFHHQGTTSNGTPTSAEVVRYTARSGARVLSVGSLQFVWGLDNYYGHGLPRDDRLVRFMRNALNDLASKR